MYCGPLLQKLKKSDWRLFLASFETACLYLKLLPVTSYRLKHADLKVAPLYPEACQVVIQKSTRVPKKCWYSEVASLVPKSCLYGTWNLTNWYSEVSYILPKRSQLIHESWLPGTQNFPILYLKAAWPGIWKLPTRHLGTEAIYYQHVLACI